jgi:DeoR family fructose operon transcriptional repressor
MNAVQRKLKILEFLENQELVEVSQLTKLLGVSKVTVRTDLDDLERKGLLVRTHGGAMLPENLKLVRMLVDSSKEHKTEKHAISTIATKFIKPDMNIIIDSGSTTAHLAKLVRAMSLTVITNSVLVIQELIEAPSIELIVAGGILHRSTLSFSGDCASYVFDQIHADLLFLGASGFSIERGITGTNIIEAETKKRMIKNASKVFLLADSSKSERMFIANICDWEDVDCFITDALPQPQRAILARKGVEVILV